MTDACNGSRRVAIPWVSVDAFLRISTNPRASREPLSPPAAWKIVDAWLDAGPVWVPVPGPGHRDLLRGLILDGDLRANLVSDASFAALALEYGLSVVSADSDFARFPTVDWINPLHA